MKIFDAHLHIIDPKYPIIPNQGYVPNHFTCKDYKEKTKNINVTGGAIVSGSFQGFDQSYLKEALHLLGEGFVGVTQLPYDVSDDEIIELHKLGVRAVRFNVKRGGTEAMANLENVARRVHEMVNWHVELYIDSTKLEDYFSLIVNLPAVSIDHLGLTQDGFHDLLRLVDQGVKVKSTGFGRLDFDPAKAMKQIHAVNPEALMFGTDLPSTRAERPFQLSDMELIIDVLGENEARKVLCENGVNWYQKVLN
ncbi:amidohydrolase family protein [Virgibacillus halodenitrificans]|uniref:amidohydrolase family protein n=1 Tax=Virgibacillus halodenitrificans TaxID=1482 RepID=UPI001F480366|nr:amidohydrolase family protein [Virgibacillus halodenitrificans]MCG1029138.1 amidohydrolase family protein [Virgibacillus halodenitrificans]